MFFHPAFRAPEQPAIHAGDDSEFAPVLAVFGVGVNSLIGFRVERVVVEGIEEETLANHRELGIADIVLSGLKVESSTHV
jgi:hypothetical protein